MLIVVYPITGKLRYLWFLADTSKLNVNLFHTSLIFLNQTLLSRTQYKDAMFPWKPLGDGINSYLQCSIYLFFASSLASYNNTSHLQSMPSIQTSPVPKFSLCVREWETSMVTHLGKTCMQSWLLRCHMLISYSRHITYMIAICDLLSTPWATMGTKNRKFSQQLQKTVLAKVPLPTTIK